VKESNVSNISKALAVVTLLTPVAGLPLSIGDIQLHSALNQNLNAEIKLRLDAGENSSDVAVRMASPEKFDKAGIPWSYFLTKIKFDVVVLDDGAIIVKLSSRESLTEPFLDFLLEVSWAQGSQYREFTLLIDPPPEYKQANLPFAENNSYREESLYSVARPERKSRPAAARPSRPAVTTQNKSQIVTNGEFGPVQKNENLWKIAGQLGKERGMPAGQMLSELYNANPDAFYHNDPNALKAGVILKIPVGDSGIGSVQQRATTGSGQKAIPKESVATEKPLKLVAPGEAKPTDNGEAVGAAGQAKEGKANDQAGLGDNGKISDAKSLELQSRVENLERQLNMMQQLLALKDQQLSQLQNSKTPPNSAVPVPAAQPPSVPVAPVAPAPVATAVPQATAPTPLVNVEPVAPTVIAPVVPVAKPVAIIPTPPPVAAVAPKPASQIPPSPLAVDEGFFSSESYYITVASFGAGVLGILGWLLWRKRRIDEQTYTESMFASASQITMPESESTLTVPVMELESPVTYDVGTVGESSFISDFTPSDFDAFDTDQNEIDPLSEADVYLAYGRYQQAEELIRNALNHEPGRDTYKLKLLEIYYAAENKEAFAKYAGVLAKDGKESDRGFWNKVSEMGKELVPEIALFGGAPAAAPTTAKTVNMAKTVNVEPVKQTPAVNNSSESLLDNDYLEALQSSMALDTNIPEDLSTEFLDLKLAFSQSGKQQTDQLDFDFSSSEAKFGIADDDLDAMNLKFSTDSEMPDEILADYANYKFETDKENTPNNALDFDLAALTSTADKQKLAASELKANNEAIDFDLGSFSFDSSSEIVKDTDDDLELESFDFNFDIDAVDKSINNGTQKNITQPEANNLTIAEKYKLPVNSGTDSEIAASPLINSDPTQEDSFSEFDFSFDFDTPLENKDSEFSKDSDFFDLNVSDLTDMDEYETKIDLAKAYVDMGDATAAKVIAEEVLGKGTRDQKLAAQALLDELR